MRFPAESQDKWTITNAAENLFPQTELHKVEDREQDRGLGGSVWGPLEEFPKGTTLMEC